MTVHLPESLAGSWRVVGSRTGESSVVLASITAETTVYEPVDPADGLAALDANDVPVRSLFTVDLSISPSLATLGVDPESILSTAAPKAREQFTATLEDASITVEELRNSLEFEASNGTAGVWSVLDVGYPADLEAAVERIDAEAHVAVWPLESTFGMAGGVVPLEELADEGAAAAGGAGLDVDPERDRETIAELIRTIDLADDAEDGPDPA